MNLLILPAADSDIEEILRWTHQTFGEQARLRYESLLTTAMEDVATDPHRSGVLIRPEIHAEFRIYHLRHSRMHTPKSIGRVKAPRHFLLFRVRDRTVEICRVLYDTMDLARHLPKE